MTRRILRDAVDGAPALDITSRASVYPDVIRFQDLTLAETGGAAWNRLGQAMGCIPFEDSNGLLGMSAMHRMAEGQQRTIPDSMRALDDSTLHSVGTVSLWALDVVTRDFAPAALAVLVTTGAVPSTRSEVIRYDYPDDVVGVEWAPPTPTAAGWSIAAWRALPAQDGSRADTVRCVIVRDNDMAQPSGVAYRGRVLSPMGGRTISLVHPPIDAAGLLRSRRQTTPPWVVHGAVGYLAPFEAMLGFVNEQKVAATLRYPLWAPTEEDRLPTHISGDRQGLLVPGSMSRYRIDADRQIDMITGLVHLQGSAVDEPTATITGVTYSAASEFTGLPLGPLPDDLPRPWMIPRPVPPVYGPTPLPPLPPPTLTLAGPDGMDVLVGWPLEYSPVDIARAPTGERGAEVVVIASDVIGNSYRDVDPGSGSVGLPAALRRCVGAVGHHHSGAAAAADALHSRVHAARLNWDGASQYVDRPQQRLPCGPTLYMTWGAGNCLRWCAPAIGLSTRDAQPVLEIFTRSRKNCSDVHPQRGRATRSRRHHDTGGRIKSEVASLVRLRYYVDGGWYTEDAG